MCARTLSNLRRPRRTRACRSTKPSASKKKDLEAKRSARDKERRAHHEAKAKNYELTLKQIDLPGLQVPKPKTDLETDKVVKATPSPLDDPEDAADEKSPVIDVSLKEAKRILLDLISLSGKGKAIAVRK